LHFRERDFVDVDMIKPVHCRALRWALEYGNGPSGSIKGREYLDQLSDHQFLKMK
jgi:hypothetical protein